MKKAICTLLTTCLLFSAMGGLTHAEGTASVSDSSSEVTKSPISGSFIQPWLYMNYDEERWDKEMKLLKDLGVEYLIMGDTLTVVTGEASGQSITDESLWQVTAHYHSGMYSSDEDCLTILFEKCKQYGIKLFVGLGNTSNGWSFISGECTGFYELCGLFANVAKDLYQQYATAYPETFAGFYFVPELYNSSAFDSDSRRSDYVAKLSKGFQRIFNQLNELDSGLPFIFSPYVNMFGGSWVSKNTENIGKFWAELFSSAGFRDGDILCPQDSIGAGGCSLELLDSVYSAYQWGCQNATPKISLWTNCELFVQPVDKYYDGYDGYNYWSSCTVDRMVQQFAIESKYADRIFTFAISHYLSPYNTVSGYYDAYRYYLENGTLETERPYAPTEFRTYFMKNQDVLCLMIQWSGMYDNIGVHRVNIYKNGEFYSYRVATRNEGSGSGDSYPNCFYDIGYLPTETETVTYEFEVIDTSGNVSGRSKLVVEPGSVPNQQKLNPQYTGPETVHEDNRSAEQMPEETSGETPSSSGIPSWIWIVVAAVVAIVAVGAFFLLRKRL